MKALKALLPAILFLLTFVGGMQLVAAQQALTAKQLAIKNLVDSQRFIFYAQNVIPMSGRQRFLTSEYTVRVSKDTIISDLPYFGTAYSAPIGNSDGGIKFTSTSFDYNTTARKKGGWNIIIKPKDATDAQQLSLTVFDNGTASLQVTSNNRQPISFNGNIKERKGKK